MHEMSITQSVVEICRENAAGRRVLAVTMEIGELSGVVPEAVEFCFAACAAGTVLEGARLDIVRIPGIGQCLDCGMEFPRGSLFDPCPGCAGYRISQLSGEELRVLDLEVEDLPPRTDTA
ncbi:putative hydrogenase nickel incorporation protein HypA [Geobacter sp. OR-1]|uniref:hydrogenase maturation nickel metallochaperone HypA/HybF n=1 Tax=Geobacter sp. OR-1 TaxID=1266765 RepID=UPI0005439197|nr:hydrogenase maturation nickel metallochaperone HypA [Geobacter sp. OR-1]GAM08715.1 putative hydrogenase nickel incorporation protein HypA [Geobacter sp. OR-1]